MSEPYYSDDAVTVWHGDCLQVMAGMPDCSVDAVCTDPPYNLSFMGRDWDTHAGAHAYQQWCQQWAAECLRVLKPGGHLIAFGGTRTSHRLVSGIEDAGFEIRDSIVWLYGSGFPKSLDVSKAIDRAAGADVVMRPRFNVAGDVGEGNARDGYNAHEKHAPVTDDARTWQGWGTALKPGHEPVCVARKPLDGTVAANVLRWGTGAINVNGGRVPATDKAKFPEGYSKATGAAYAQDEYSKTWTANADRDPAGRWPPNVALDADAAADLDRQSGIVRSAGIYNKGAVGVGPKIGAASIPIDGLTSASYGDHGGASRFFYVAKAPTHERPKVQRADGTWHAHPTVKPLTLIRWLVRLHTPPGGLVLDPFAGSGTTGEAAIVEGFRSLLVEREPCGNCGEPHGCDDNIGLIMRRISKPIQPVLNLGGPT